MPAPAVPPPTGPRIGGVLYLNSRPLIDGLRRGLLRDGGRLTLDHPSRLAEGLTAGAYDAALVPSVAALRTPGSMILSDACVAARGAVRSVKLFFRVPPGEVRTLALDEGSRTSAALARVLLAERFGVHPERRPLPVGPAPRPGDAADAVAGTDADAVLLIGDRAMVDPPDRRTGRPFVQTWDLGRVWNDWTGLPFVFAVWASRAGLPGAAAVDLSRRFSESRDEGRAQIDRLAAAGGPPLGLTPEDAANYLRHNLHFTLGPAERAGLSLYAELCVKNGLLPPGARPAYAPADQSPPSPAVELARPPAAARPADAPHRVIR